MTHKILFKYFVVRDKLCQENKIIQTKMSEHSRSSRRANELSIIKIWGKSVKGQGLHKRNKDRKTDITTIYIDVYILFE